MIKMNEKEILEAELEELSDQYDVKEKELLDLLKKQANDNLMQHIGKFFKIDSDEYLKIIEIVDFAGGSRLKILKVCTNYISISHTLYRPQWANITEKEFNIQLNNRIDTFQKI